MQLRKRLLGALADLAIGHPWKVCLVSALLAGLAVAVIAWKGLAVETSRAALWPEDHPLQERFRAFEEEFGSSFQLIVAIEGEDPARNKEAADHIAARIRAEVPAIHNVFHRVALDEVKERALLFAPIEDLREAARWAETLTSEAGEAAPLAIGGLVGLMERANEALAGVEEGETKLLSRLDEHVGPLLEGGLRVFDELDTWIEEPERRELRIVEQSAGELGGDEGFDPQGYLVADGGRLVVLLCQPGEARDDLGYLESFVKPIRAIAAEEEAKLEGVTVGLTGMPVFSTEEMGIINTDLSFITLVSAVGVLLLFILGYGSLWNTLFIAVTLTLGVLLDLALTAAFVGRVNLVSSLFVAVLLGLGIDYGIQLITRLQEELRRGATAAAAIRTAVVFTGEGVLTGGVTTAVAFFTMALGEFAPLVQLGLVAGAGILLILAASFVLLPAQLMLHLRRDRGRAASGGGLLSGSWRLPVLPLRGRRPAIVVMVLALAGTVLIALPIRPITFANDQLSMLPQALPSVTWLRKLETTGMFTSSFSASIADDLEEARVRGARFAALPSVSRVQSLATFLPPDQEAKAPLIARVRAALRRLPTLTVDSPPVDVAAFAAQLEELHGYLELDLPLTLETLGRGEHKAGLQALAERLKASLAKLRALPPAQAAARLGHLQDRLAGLSVELANFIASDADSLRPEDLPPEVARLLYSETPKGGRFLLRVYPAGDVNDDAFMARFLAETRAVDPVITGYSVNYYEFGLVMQSDFRMAFLYAVLAIILLLSLDLRRPLDVLLALIPLAIGGVWMVGVMNLIDLEYNLANIMAIPLIVGIGVAYGVYVIHRVRESNPPHPREVVATTGKAVLFSALTTMVSFGAMSFASHRGASGLGITLLFGISFCLLSSLGVLPALLRLARPAGGKTEGER